MRYFFIIIALSTLLVSCDQSSTYQEINIGYIGPLSTRATDLGIAPSKAIQLAVEEYNQNKTEDQPLINLFIEDDKWEKDEGIAAYRKLRDEHNVQVVFVSNSEGTVGIQEDLIKDKVICINPLNSDELLSSLNVNTFKIAKRTEEANSLIGIRIAELDYKNVAILHFPNDFMTRAANAVNRILDEYKVKNTIIPIQKGQTDYTEILQRLKNDNVDAIVFFGYKNMGHGMKQARDLGIEAPFFGSTTTLSPEFYDNSQGTISGTEITFFTPADGNYILASEFLEKYRQRFNETPMSAWPPLQAYDAANMLLSQLKTINEEPVEQFDIWLRKKLHMIDYYPGVCGNLSIGPDGSANGIYFSLYRYAEKGQVIKVKR